MSGDDAGEGPVGPVIIEQGFRVDGQKLTVRITFPAEVAREFGMDTVLQIANKGLVAIETKNHEVRKVRG